MTINRYEIESAGGSDGDHWLSVESDATGEWVKFDDVLAKLWSEVKRLEDEAIFSSNDKFVHHNIERASAIRDMINELQTSEQQKEASR